VEEARKQGCGAGIRPLRTPVFGYSFNFHEVLGKEQVEFIAAQARQQILAADFIGELLCKTFPTPWICLLDVHTQPLTDEIANDEGEGRHAQA